MELCTDPTAPDFTGAITVTGVTALITQDIALSVSLGMATFLGVMALKDLMERYIRSHTTISIGEVS